MDGVTLSAKSVGANDSEWTIDESKATSAGTSEREVRYFAQTGSAYTVETTIEGLDKDWAQAGILFQVGNTQYAFTVMYSANDGYAPLLLTLDPWNAVWLLDGTEYNGWMESVSKLKLVNDGTQITLYCNDVLVGTISADYGIGQESTVGLLTISDSVTFKDYSVTFAASDAE